MRNHTFRYFFIPYLLFLILAVMYISICEHGALIIWLNNYHNDLLDILFKVWTYGGDEIIYGIIAIALLIWRRRFGYIFLLVGSVVGLTSWSMKQFFFSHTPRPKKFFEGKVDLNFVDGVMVLEYNSFPSGHTMTAFAMAAFLAIMIGKKGWSIGLVLIAVLVGISRMYLNQHFLVDVTVGSFIGVMVSLILYKIFERYLSRQDK